METISVLMFPWLAHGHISPFLELAKKLTQRNFHIYFCSTPINLNSIKEMLHEDFPSIQLVELHLPSLPDLPPQYHTTKGLPPHLMPTLKEALHLAKPKFSEILKSIKPDLIIYDFIQDWAATQASSHNIPAVQFLTFSAAVICYFLHVLKDRKDVAFPFPGIYLRDYERIKIEKMNEEAHKQADNEEDRMNGAFKLSSITLIKTFPEMEAKYIDYASILTGKKIVPVGSLVQEHTIKDDHNSIIEWLDRKGKSSSVYISFGSEYFLSKEEMEEIAHGLELSNLNFIWVVRFPMGERIKIEEALPDGFLENTKERGLVVEGWAPQARILKHLSIGGFVSHCGWSSLMEGLTFGAPIIAMPMHLDQPINARLVEEIGVGVEVKRDKEGRLERNEIARVLKEVVVEKAGEGVRRKVSQFSKIMASKGEEEIDVLVEELVQLHNKHKL